MKKSLLAIFSLVAVCILGMSLQASAFSFTVNWDNPGALQIIRGGVSDPALSIDANATTWTGTETGALTFKPAPGYIILSVHEKYTRKDTQTKVEGDLKLNGNPKNGQSCYKFIGAVHDGAEYTVTTKKLSSAGKVTIDVQNGLDKFDCYFTNDKAANTASYVMSTFARPLLKKGVQEVNILDQDKYLSIETPGTAKIYSVKLNGTPQSANSYKMYEVPVKDGDKIEIRVYEQDPEVCDVLVRFTNGESCLTHVRNRASSQNTTSEQLVAMGNKLSVDKGDELWFYFDEDFNMESVTVDGETKPITSGYYAIKIDKGCTIEFTATAKVYTPVEITLYLKNAQGLIFRKGAFEEDEVITIGEGEELAEDIVYADLGVTLKKGEVKKYTALVPGKRPQIFWSARPGYWVPKAVMLNPEDKGYTWPSPGVMAENCPLYLEATEVVADHQLVIFFDGAEKEAKIFVENPKIAGRLPLKGLDDEFYVPVGYTMSAYDPDYHLSFSTGKVGGAHGKMFQVFVNGNNISPADDGSFGLPISGDPAIVKIFSLDAQQTQDGWEIINRIQKNNITFETVGSCSAEVTYDKVFKHKDLSTPLEVIGKTLISMKPAAGTYVVVDGTTIEPNNDGVCEFMTSKRNHKVMLTNESGVTDIEAAETAGDGRVYNLQGIEMTGDYDNLPAGVYIRNGKKVIKK